MATFLIDYLSELFVFLQHPAMSSLNNGAEWAVNGLVVARKFCGGTRSAQGSQAKMFLSSLLDSCVVRGLDPVAALTEMFYGKPIFSVSTS